MTWYKPATTPDQLVLNCDSTFYRGLKTQLLGKLPKSPTNVDDLVTKIFWSICVSKNVEMIEVEKVGVCGAKQLEFQMKL